MYHTTGSQQGTMNPMEMNNNDMTPGASGGPWMINRNGRYYANSVNSLRGKERPCSMFGPYFDSDALSDDEVRGAVPGRVACSREGRDA